MGGGNPSPLAGEDLEEVDGLGEAPEGVQPEVRPHAVPDGGPVEGMRVLRHGRRGIERPF